MTIQECYEKMEGSYEDIKSRLPNDKLIEKFLIKFASDTTMDSLIQAKNNGDINEAFAAAHTLKGVAANLGFEKLIKTASELTEQLRPLKEQPDPVLFEKTKESYDIVLNVINEYIASNNL